MISSPPHDRAAVSARTSGRDLVLTLVAAFGKADAINARLITLQREVTDADEKLKRLYRLIEDGMTEMDDVLTDYLNTLKADRDRARASLERAKPHSAHAILIDPALLEPFGRNARENFAAE
jgi:site-specific DNA recombinase